MQRQHYDNKPYTKSPAYYQAELIGIETTIQQIRSRSGQPSINLLNKKLDLLHKSKQFDAAKSLFDKIGSSANIFTLTIMCGVYADSGEFDPVEKLFSGLNHWDLEIDIAFLNSLLQLYLKYSEHDKLTSLLKKIEDNHFKLEPDFNTYTIKLELLIRQKQLDEAEKLFNFIVSHSKESNFDLSAIHFIMAKIEFYYAKDDFQGLEELFDSMLNHTRLTPDHILPLIMINFSIARSGNADVAVADKTFLAIEEIEKKYKLPMDIFILNSKLRYYVEIKDVDTSEKMYEQIKFHFHDDEDIYMTLSHLFGLYVYYNKLPMAEQILQEIITIEKKYHHNRMAFIDAILLKFYIQKGEVNLAKKLFKRIHDDKNHEKERQTIYRNMLILHVKELDQSSAESIFNFLKDNSALTTYSCNLMLSLYIRLKQYDLAENILAEFSKNQLKPNESTYNCIFEIYNRKHRGTQDAEIFADLSHQLSFKNYLLISKNIIHDFNWNKIHFMDIIFLELRNFINHAEVDAPDYRKNLRKVIQAHVRLVDRMNFKARGKEKREKYTPLIKQYQGELIKLVTKLKDLFSDQEKRLTITTEEVALLNLYFPKQDFTPDYPKLSKTEWEKERLRICASLNHPVQPLNESMQFTIKEIEASGYKLTENTRNNDKTKEYQLNDSTYYHLTGGKKFYSIIKFNKSPKKIPVYHIDKGTIYTTTFCQGSKLKSKPREGNYGSLIAVPLEAMPYIQPFAPYIQAQAYFNKIVTPEAPNQITRGLKGSFIAAIIPDAMNYTFLPSFMSQDGCGAIKESVLRQSLIKEDYLADTEAAYTNSAFTSYQMLQWYEAAGYESAVEELVEQNKPEILALKRKLAANEKITPEEVKRLYPILSGGLPKMNGIAIAVVGDKLYLPKTKEWEGLVKSGNGVFVGRDPFDAKKVQVFTLEQIVLSEELAKLSAVQYCFSGYQQRGMDSEYKFPSPFFAKGLSVIVPDNKWPAELSNCDMLLSANDVKVKFGWTDKDTKYQGQNPEGIIQVKINGVYVIKQYIKGNKLIGIPEKTAKESSGDNDGDNYGVSAIPKAKDGGESKVAAMIVEQNKQAIRNPKVEKIVTAANPDRVDNLEKVIQLCESKFVEDWTVIGCVFLSLALPQRNAIAKILAADHQLQAYLGENWQAKLNHPKPIDEVTIVIKEILMGIKFGEDGPKTEIPYKAIEQRLKEYQAEFRKVNPGLSVFYNKNLQRKLLATITKDDQVDSKALIDLLTKLYMKIEASYRGPANIVSEVQKRHLASLYVSNNLFAQPQITSVADKPPSSAEQPQQSLAQASSSELTTKKKKRKKKKNHSNNQDVNHAVSTQPQPQSSAASLFSGVYNTLTYFAAVPSYVYNSVATTSSYLTNNLFGQQETTQNTVPTHSQAVKKR